MSPGIGGLGLMGRGVGITQCPTDDGNVNPYRERSAASNERVRHWRLVTRRPRLPIGPQRGLGGMTFGADVARMVGTRRPVAAGLPTHFQEGSMKARQIMTSDPAVVFEDE